MRETLALNGLKGTWGQNVIPVFIAYLCLFHVERDSHKVPLRFGQFSQVMKLQNFEFSVSDVMSSKTVYIWFSLHFFVNSTKEETSTKFYGIFNYFFLIWNYKVLNE